MVVYKDECVGCPPEKECLGGWCPNRHVKHCYCDQCGEEEQLYEFDGKELCLDCIERLLVKIK